MSTDLQEFFSLIGKAKKEKEDEFNELVGDLSFDSLFTEVASLKKENQEKKEKEKRQAEALESWLYASPQKEENVEETEDHQEEYEISEETTTDEEELEENISEENESDDDDTIDHALKVLEELKSKEEVQENLGDPEILKIRRELEYLKNLVNAQGGGGETRLRYLDDIVGIATNLSAYNGMYLGIDTSNSAQPFVFSSVSSGAGATTLNDLNDVTITSVTNHDVLIYDAPSEDFINEPGVQRLILDARNNNIGYALTAGIPVYQSGYNSGQDRINVETSDANISSTMPAKGLVYSDIANNTNGKIIVQGELEGIDTSAFEVADELYVAPGGGLTTTRPSGSNQLVQKIAVVLKKSASNGAVLVYGAGRTNDVPNEFSVSGIITAGGFVGPLTGSASSLSGVSSSFLLDYDNFTNTPTIPTNNNQLTNGAGYITTSFTNTNQLTNGAGFITASDNITGTAAGLSGTPDITVQNITGVAATFTGNVSIAGTLTYEDVTNIDSVGIVTARSGVQIGSPAVVAIETATSTKTSTAQASVDTFTAATYRSAQFQVQVTRGSAYHMTTINVIHDGTSAYMTEFGTVKTGTSLATFDADISSGSVRLLATPSSATSTVFKISKTLTTV